MRLIVLLGLLAAVPSMAIDGATPGFVAMQTKFASTPGQSGLTIAVFMAGFALAQLVLGPVSDVRGRLPVLTGGLALFAAASAGCAVSPGILTLIGLRLVAGIGAAAATVIAYAVIRDLFEGDEARSRISAVSAVYGISPLVAPFVGTAILNLFGWRAIHALFAAIGLVLLVASCRQLRAERIRGRSAGSAAAALRGALASCNAVVGNATFLRWVTLDALSFASMFAFVAGGALMFMSGFGIGPAAFSASFAAAAAGAIAGAWLSGRLVACGLSADDAIGLGMSGAVLAAAAMAFLIIAGSHALLPLTACACVVLGCRGLAMPSMVGAAFQPLPEAGGAAAGMLGFAEVLAASIASFLVSAAWPVAGPLGVALVMALFAATALAYWWFVARRAVAAVRKPAPRPHPSPHTRRRTW